jgi:cytochrome bd-type quinol oxidase subunit 2
MCFKNMKKFRYLFILILLFSFLFSSGMVLANSAKDGFKNSLNETAKETGHNTDITTGSVFAITGKVINASLSIIGVLFLGLMIYGGIIWMIARGNEQNTEKAKKIIRNSIIGLIIVFAAYAITAFVGVSLNRVNQPLVEPSGIED